MAENRCVVRQVRQVRLGISYHRTGPVRYLKVIGLPDLQETRQLVGPTGTKANLYSEQKNRGSSGEAHPLRWSAFGLAVRT